MTSKHDTEIRIEKELSRLSASFESLENKIDFILQDMKLISVSKEANHNNIWDVVNSHGRSIAAIKAVGSGFQVLWASLIALLSLHK